MIKYFPFEKKATTKNNVVTLFWDIVNNIDKSIEFNAKAGKLNVKFYFKQIGGHKLIDFFVEDLRIKGKRYNASMSLETYFIKNAKRLISRTKDEIYALYFKECNGAVLQSMFFVVPLFIYDSDEFSKLKSLNILDMCGGWGDRLMAAIGSKKCRFYHAVDTNKKLHARYQTIMDTLFVKKKAVATTISQFEILTPKFLIDKIPNKHKWYDMMFSSPPYFIMEQYDPSSKKEISQTYSADDVDLWLDGFVYKSLDIIDRVLNPKSGVLILMMENIVLNNKPINYVENIIKYMTITKGYSYTLYQLSRPNKKNENILCFKR